MKVEPGIDLFLADVDNSAFRDTNRFIHSKTWRPALASLLAVHHITLNDVVWEWLQKRAFDRPECVTVQQFAADILDKFGVTLSPNEIVSSRVALMRELSCSPTEGFPEIVGVCRERGIKTCAVTSSSRGYIDWIFAQAKIQLDRYVTADDFEKCRLFKPLSIPWVVAMDRMGVLNTDEIKVALEDNFDCAVGAYHAHPKMHVFLVCHSDEVAKLQEQALHKHFRLPNVQDNDKPVLDQDRFRIIVTLEPLLKFMKGN